MAVNLDLINKTVILKCPVCHEPYEYSLVGILGINLNGTYGTEVLGLLDESTGYLGGTLNAAEAGELARTQEVQLRHAALQLNLDPTTRMNIEAALEAALKKPSSYIFTCPKDQKQLQVTLQLVKDKVEASTPEAVTPNNAALYEAGKQIQTNSLSIATSFCSSMVTISAAAVAVYTGLLAVVVPKSSSLLWPWDLVAIIPAAGFIIATIFFALGAYPHIGRMVLSNPESIENFRTETINCRVKFTIIGFSILCASFIVAFIIIAWIAGTPQSISPAISPTVTPTLTPTLTPTP